LGGSVCVRAELSLFAAGMRTPGSGATVNPRGYTGSNIKVKS